jgi:ParB-like chromosome segregation protein Spo0J
MKEQLLFEFCDESSEILPYDGPVNIEQSIDDIKAILVTKINELPLDDKVDALNEIRESLHGISPFKSEPVDMIKWVKVDGVAANDYNPNAVAPPEMELLRHSINHDGYTQPVVTWMSDEKNQREVIDGFHRTRVCRELEDVNKRVHGYLPVVTIAEDNTGQNDRMASTIRHNRARGKHSVESMSDIVVELKKRNWSDNKIAKELGMDQDEVLRLCQITGLTELFSNDDFSQAWESNILDDSVEQLIDESDVESLDNDDCTRIFHEWEDWECYPAGFYGDKPPKGMTKDECEIAYRDFLANVDEFEKYLKRIIVEWKFSCEHYLTNEKMNRIAWLGQASMCLATGIPARFCAGYNLLTDDQKEAADRKALEYLNIWLKENDRTELDWDSAQSKTQANIY